MHGATSTPPLCSASDGRRSATLQVPALGSTEAMRFCGPASASIRLNGKRYRIEGGHCFYGRPPYKRTILSGVAIGLITNPPKRPGLGISLFWDPPVTRAGSLVIDDSEIELNGMRIAASGQVYVAGGLRAGSFRLYGRDASGLTGPRLRGSWTCG
jgi:hypothetical protein